MVTARKATFEELTKLATDFVTIQKGMWDHTAWTDFVSRVREKGFDISGEVQPNLGELLEAIKRFYAAAAATESIENAMKTIVDDSVTFVKRHKGVWGHDDWVDFTKTVKQNSLTYTEGTTAYLGGVLESMKVIYSLSPILSDKKPALAADKKAEPKRSDAKAEVAQKSSGKNSDKQDDLTAISGIGPALAKKLKAEGIFGYAQLAALSENDIEHLEKNIIKFPGRIKRDDWVGQAKRLSQD